MSKIDSVLILMLFFPSPLLLCSDSTSEEFFPRALRNASILSVVGIWSHSRPLHRVAPLVIGRGSGGEKGKGGGRCPALVGHNLARSY